MEGGSLKLSVIVPTYGRSSELVNQTVKSILTCSDSDFIEELIIVDQNETQLEISPNLLKVKHLYGFIPSLTKARNVGVEHALCEVVVFFDDDVIVHDNTFEAYVNTFLRNPEIDFVGGREELSSDIERVQNAKLLQKIKGVLRNMFFQLQLGSVASITKNGFFFCDFSLKIEELVFIDTVRGCNFAVRREKYLEVNGFDTDFKGTSYREESDFILRLRKLGSKGLYNSKASVLHLRQFGGCNNLSLSIKSLRSKLDNEFLFQRKHFSQTPKVLFFIRILPLLIEHLLETRGKSLLLGLQYALRF